MARIRTIKPDFWTDERLTECSVSARLLFIGLLNFSDDNGNLQRSAKKIKMQIFPADNIDCEPLICELLTHGVLIEYSVNGEKFLNIKNFRKHQVINRPSKSSIPLPNFTEHSVSPPVAITEPSLTEGKGREGNRKTTSAPNRVAFDAQRGILTGFVDEQLQRWGEAYPALNLKTEIAKAGAWLAANPKNRKSNLERFVVNWLSRAQDKAPRVNGGGAQHDDGRPTL